MTRNEGLQKLNFLIKELNDTHNRLQASREDTQQIEVALLNQQVLVLYSHIQKILPLVSVPERSNAFADIAAREVAAVERMEEQLNRPVQSSVADAARKKALLQKTEKEEQPAPAPQSQPKEEPATIILSVQEPVAQAVPIPPMPEPEPVAEIKQPEQEEIKPVPEEKPAPAPEMIDTPSAPVAEEKPALSNSESELKPVPKTEQSLHEKLSVNAEPSLNERFSGLQNKPNLAEKLKKSPVKDLNTAISLNQRIAFIRVLFNGDGQDFRNSISQLNNFRNYAEAKAYIAEIAEKHEWDRTSSITDEFMELVSRRFMEN